MRRETGGIARQDPSGHVPPTAAFRLAKLDAACPVFYLPCQNEQEVDGIWRRKPGLPSS